MEKYLKNGLILFTGKKIAEFRAIQYGEKEQEIKDIIRELLELEKDADSDGCSSDSDIYTHPFYQYLEKRAIDGYYIKDKGFREEKESRLIYREYYRSEDTHQLDLWEHSSYSEVNHHILEYSLSDVKYHCRPKGFRKYFELSFEKVKDSLIKEIVIGPKCELDIEDIEELLQREGYSITGKDKIYVKRSEIIMR